MYYRLVFSKNSKLKSALKILLLIAGLLCDIAALIGIFMAIFGMPKYLYLLASLVFSVLFRIVSLRLNYNVESKLQDNHLIISKVYPNKTQIIFKEKLGDFKIVPYNFENLTDFSVNNETRMNDNEQNAQVQEENATACNLTCTNNLNESNVINLLANDYEKYMVISKNTKVLCNLDRYIYAVALKGEEI